MSSSLGHQGRPKAPSRANASGEPSSEHSARHGSPHFDSPLPVTASDVPQRSSALTIAQGRIVLLKAELRGSEQDIAQLERDVTHLTKDLQSQRNQILVFRRREVDFRKTITQLEAENERLREQGLGSTRVRALETRVGALAADRKTVEEGIIMSVSVEMDTMIEAIHDSKARICEAVRAQFAAGVGQSAENILGDAHGRLKQNIETIGKSGHTKTIVGPGPVAQDEQPVLPSPSTQLALGTYRKLLGSVRKPRAQQVDTLTYGAFRNRFNEAFDDELHRLFEVRSSPDLVLPSMEPEDTFGVGIGDMSDSDLSITTTLVPHAHKSLAEKRRGAEKTEPLRLGSSTSEDNVIPVISPGKPADLLSKSATPGSLMSSMPWERMNDGKWNPSSNPKDSNKHRRLGSYPGDEDGLSRTKRRRTNL